MWFKINWPSVWDRLLGSPGWPQAPHVTKDDLKFPESPAPISKNGGISGMYHYAQFYLVLEMEPRIHEC